MKQVTGDLIKMAMAGNFDVITHGCNAWNTMGKGIAKQIKEIFPPAYEADQKTTKGDINKLGTITYAKCDIGPRQIIVVNAYTQFNYWSPGEPRTAVYVDYAAIRLCFKKIKHYWGSYRIGIPMIGAGLAGGDWNIISKIIDEEMQGEDVTLVIYEESK
jgi:O-acetyl-ADP-ribose deacetylase (regulator of RNase III)